MIQQLWIALRVFLIFTVVTGLIYPLAVTGFAQAIFPLQANGSIVVGPGGPVGSSLIGQSFSRDEYFHGRPSSAGEKGYDGRNSGGSNMGPTNQKFLAAAADNVQQVRAGNHLDPSVKVPSDLVLASGSGLDPEISPAAAYLQVERIARTRKIPVEEVRRLVDKNVKGPQFEMLGSPRVNVLELNLALDGLKRQPE